MFKPINPPPSDHHGFAMGLSTEFGDTAKTAIEKINAGFAHVYSMLGGVGKSLADEAEYVAKSEFDALVHEMDETKAELRNIKMMVQGLGFAGAKPQPLQPVAITDPSHSMSFTADPVVKVSEAKPADEVAPVEGSEPVVTVTEKSAS